MRIRIKSTPSGPVSKWVRERWNGIELESIGKEKLTDLHTLIGRCGHQNMGGYIW